jgi:cyclopropane fatty-acyl-phospholipid synthase-like methyltransferase
LNRKSVALVLGAGLGALARAAAAHGANVTAIETDAQLVAAANRVAHAGDPSQKAYIQHGDYERIKIGVGTLDAVLAQQALYDVPNRSRVPFSIRKMMKLSGKIIISDLVRRCPVDNPNYLVWSAHEGLEAPLYTPEELKKELTDLGFEIESFDDISDGYRQEVVTAFATHAARMQVSPAPEETQRYTVEEGEFWSRRIGLMAAKEIAVVKVVASVPRRG